VRSKRNASTFLRWVLCLLAAAGLVAAEDPAVSEEKAAADAETAEQATGEAPAKAEETPSEDEREAERKEAQEAEIARPVSADPVQIYGWREWIFVSDGKSEEKMPAKLDTGALTSSIHAEEKELFERDGKKWVRFVVTDPGEKDSKRLRIEAPLVRIARIKTAGAPDESEAREVVKLTFRIGDRKVRADFTLNDRHNMLAPALIGRRTIRELGWVDASRAYLADKKLMR